MEGLIVGLVLVSILTFLTGIVWGRKMKSLENESKIISIQHTYINYNPISQELQAILSFGCGEEGTKAGDKIKVIILREK